MIKPLPQDTTAEEFAKYIAENKPYLIEIEDEIQSVQRVQTEAQIRVEINIRGGNVVNIVFWKNRVWKRGI